MDSPGGGLALTLLVLIITLFCSISITVAASRCTWAFARDHALPLSPLWARVRGDGTPLWALVLTTLVQLLLGLINLGSSSAFLAFVSVGVVSLAVSYGIPIAISLFHRRRDVDVAAWTLGPAAGWAVNVVALLWILFETVLFSMPTVLPVTAASMNYAIVVFLGFMLLSAVWYAVYARKGWWWSLFVPLVWSLPRKIFWDMSLTSLSLPSLQRTTGIRWSGNCVLIEMVLR